MPSYCIIEQPDCDSDCVYCGDDGGGCVLYLDGQFAGHLCADCVNALQRGGVAALRVTLLRRARRERLVAAQFAAACEAGAAMLDMHADVRVLLHEPASDPRA